MHNISIWEMRVIMPVKVNNFLGKFGWNARKYFPNLASSAYLKMQFLTRGKSQQAYVDFFLKSETVPQPMVVNIETINRCNSTCSFCTANKNAEKRPYLRMEEELFYSIIDQLAAWNYRGHLTLYGNNEPWLDTRIVELHKYAREKLPESFIFMSTNGLLLDINQVKQVQPYIDQLIINNYCMDMKLHDNVQQIYDYVTAHPEEFTDLDIQIQMRYLQEVLTNRAGSAPNKKATEKVIKDTCLLPFTDMWIMPNGKMGLCCCDNFEVTNYADLHTTSLQEGWSGEAFMKVRKLIAQGRQNYKFCEHCDFIDAGFRKNLCEAALAGGAEAAGSIGGQAGTKIVN